MYDLDIFIENVEFVVARNDEPECCMDFKDGTRIEFICYKDFIDVYLGEKRYKFSDVTAFVNNMKIGEKTLKSVFDEVVSIQDDLDMIDFKKTCAENFGENGGSIRKYFN